MIDRVFLARSSISNVTATAAGWKCHAMVRPADNKMLSKPAALAERLGLNWILAERFGLKKKKIRDFLILFFFLKEENGH